MRHEDVTAADYDVLAEQDRAYRLEMLRRGPGAIRETRPATTGNLGSPLAAHPVGWAGLPMAGSLGDSSPGHSIC
jgi:hypothetical protein